MTCRHCGAEVFVNDDTHDIVLRFNTTEGPGPYPFLVLHSPWASKENE